MFEFLVQASLRNRLLVLALAAALMGLGAVALDAHAGLCLPQPGPPAGDAAGRGGRHGARGGGAARHARWSRP